MSVLAWWSGKLAWADHLSRSSRLADREYAVRLFPAASLYIRLAEKREEAGGDPLPDLVRAVELEPEQAEWRIRLGLRAELAGDLALAETNLQRAAALSRMYQPRYLLAQYYFRRQNADLFQQWTREAFSKSYGEVWPLLELCWRWRPDGEWLAQIAACGREEVALRTLEFLASRGQCDAGRPLARTLTGTAAAENAPRLLRYASACLEAGKSRAAAELWNGLCARGAIRADTLDPSRGVSLTNGDFRRRPSGLGFDWRITDAAWARLGPFGEGLRLQLSGNQPERCVLAWQFIPVVAGARYRLQADAPGGDHSAESVDWEVYDAARRPVAVTGDPVGARTFVAPDELLRLTMIYQRPRGSTRMAGTLAIDRVRLERLP